MATAVVLLICICYTANAQTDTRNLISGRVYDKSTGQPLDYATVSIIKKETAKVLTGGLTGSDGVFKIYDIPFGTYTVNVDHISYEKTVIDSVTLSKTRPSVSLGAIYVTPSMLNLGEVNIVADKPVIENKPGKTIYNVASDITSQGGLAIDVLKKVPQVTVDVDGNVELQGNSNIRFLINGKSSSIFGNNLADALSSIPASQIKSIETITNPGAKYDSQGTGGIINIILVDNKLQGASGNINLSAGTRLENGSVNLSTKRNNFGVNTFFNGNWKLKSEGTYSNNRKASDTTAGVITNLLQDGLDYTQRNGFRAGLGFDWDITKKDNLTGSVGYNQFSFSNSGLTNQQESIQDLFGSNNSWLFTTRNSSSSREVRSTDWDLDYKRDFKKEGHELSISLNASYGKPNSSYGLTEFFSGQPLPYKGSESKNPGTDDQMEITADYAYPVNDKFKIETGLKATVQNLTSIANVNVLRPTDNEYLRDTLQSYNLKYNLGVYAGYITTGFRLFNFLDLKPGVRYEYTNVGIDYPSARVPSYGTLVPSVVLSHNFKEKNTLELSYSKRIERPEYRELNPFTDLSDPYNITTGNIFLKPEIGNNLELSFSRSFKKGGNIRVGLWERMTSQEIDPVTVFYPEYVVGDSTYKDVSVTTRQNVGREYNSGISTSVSINVTSKFNLRGNLILYNRYLVSSLSAGDKSTGLNARLNMNASYQLPGNLVVELFGFYRSPSNNLQGRTPQFFIYNFAFRKKFWNQNGSLGFTTTNPLNKNIRMINTISTGNLVSSSIRELPFRSFGVSFTYKFGKMQPQKKNRDNGNDSVMPENNFN
ncbi:MAG: TonB-dependent receptor [Bacteroidota bacterium]|nr:TonB-dependent receptor [Bacteroidota bacterium]